MDSCISGIEWFSRAIQSNNKVLQASREILPLWRRVFLFCFAKHCKDTLI